MTDEGVFPKIDGDILYASEANRFSPKLIGYVDQSTLTNISGASETYTTMGGTITYYGTIGSIQITDFMIVDCVPFNLSTEAASFRLRISGAAGLNMITSTKSISVRGTSRINHVFTSGILTSSGGNIGSDYIISVEGNNNSNANQGGMDDFLVWGY